MKSWKAAGVCGNPGELLKVDGEKVMHELAAIFNEVLSTYNFYLFIAKQREGEDREKSAPVLRRALMGVNGEDTNTYDRRKYVKNKNKEEKCRCITD